MNPTVCSGISARTRDVSWGWHLVVCLFALTAAVLFAVPDAGAAPGPFVKMNGKVTNSYTGAGVAGATITLTATGTTITMTTDASGNYSNGKVQVGTYSMSTSKGNYTSASQSVSLLKGTVTVNVPLTPVARVIVSAGVTGSAAPGANLSASGTCLIMDGSTLNSGLSGWSQGAEGVPTTIGSGLSTTIQLPSADTYLADLIEVLQSPPISEADLPPDIKLQPYNEIEKGLQDRNQVVAINPQAMEKNDALPLVFTCKTNTGTFTKAVSLSVKLPWVVNTGVKTVPVSSPVLLLAKCGQSIVDGEWTPCAQTAFSWHVTAAPSGSTAALTGDTSRTPRFTPDKVGTYTIQETNGSGASIEVHAGRYHGAIDPLLTLNSVVMDDDGFPVADQNCTSCHYEGGAAPANFDTWRLTGHAGAFSDQVTTSTHFGESCFACHAVGFGTTSGIDSTPNYSSFLGALSAAQLSGNVSGVWEDMLTNQPDTARLANVQCENCHGPQDYADSHKDQPGAPRVSLGAEVCGSCHGEPARHGRFQQWQLSSHADYDLARSRGLSSNCTRCHSGNGFVAWSKYNFDPAETLSGNDASGNPKISWNADSVVPQTCPTCHNPHDTGTTSGLGTDAKVRVNADGTGACGDSTCNTNVLLAGFKATSVGKAATCMTCHNSRGGVLIGSTWIGRNDATWSLLTSSQKTGTPHHGVQADLLMGQNAYFMAPGDLVRGKHSLLPNVCVTCHMEKTSPPPALSFMTAPGTNHTFSADPNICSDCHGSGITADNINAVVTGYMGDLASALGNAYMRMMVQHYPVTSGAASGASDASCPGTGSVSADGTTTTITSVGWVYSNRVQITTSDGVCRNVAISGITIGGTTPSLQTFSLQTGNDAVWKAMWNYGLLAEDSAGRTDHPGDRGVHNPDFSIKILTRAITAVQAVSP